MTLLVSGAILASAFALNYAKELTEAEVDCNKHVYYAGVLFVTGATVGLVTGLMGFATQVITTYKAYQKERDTAKQVSLESLHVREVQQ